MKHRQKLLVDLLNSLAEEGRANKIFRVQCKSSLAVLSIVVLIL